MKLAFARAIAADCIDVDAGADHVVGQDRRARLVGGAGRDDLGSLDHLL